ncbi:DUF6144 family protein [Miniphocaeibacter massiliensis]|uniref:DUF6144 family protein n=1 Tax=Miniphocaeibacter massiliensis TaxID=2041841 RepID=UPI000C1C4660|nr:DUF6144 family protein [Miniphocaeibacter massiliensis]
MGEFSMPDYISPTLELDEIGRLKNSLEKVASKEVVEEIILELPLDINSTPTQRAEWVEKLSVLLENRFDNNIVKLIRKGCYCNENGKLKDTAIYLKKIYLSVNKDLYKFVEILNENGAGWYIKGNFLYTKMFSCECPMLEESKISESLTWCHCTAGYNKKLFEIVFDKSVEVEILQSMRQGFDYCLIEIKVN